MLDPIIKTIEVPCSQPKAFDVFVNEMDTWWPLGKFTVSAYSGAPAKGIRVDARPGGQIVEIGPNGTEYLWGTIRSYEPHDFVTPLEMHGRASSSPRAIGKHSVKRRRCCATVGTAGPGSPFSRGHSRRPAAADARGLERLRVRYVSTRSSKTSSWRAAGDAQ